MKYRFFFIAISLLLFAVSCYAWVMRGDGRWGVDFAGGSEILVQFQEEIGIGEIRAGLAKGGIENAVVQAFPQGRNEFSIRIKTVEEKSVTKQVEAILNQTIPGKTLKILKDDYVGPVIGAEMARNGLIALSLSIVGILIYVSVRFEFRFALGAIVALAHDVLLSAGMFLLAGGEMNSTIIAALLAILGFSVNDTIVVFDRIRENIGKMQKKFGSITKRSEYRELMEKTINLSINETLSRTIITNMTAFFCTLCLLLFGGGALWELSFTLTVGMVVGTYSSIFIASPIVMMFERGE